MLVVLGAINFRGIKESSWTNIVCTAVEATGLLIVLLAGLTFVLGPGPAAAGAAQGAGPVQDAPTWLGVARGAALAFFAFIGFEDLANVAEEAKEPRRHLPIAIVAAMLITGTFYMVISWLAVSVVPPGELAKVEGPLQEIVHRAWPAFPDGIFLIIALFAVSNTGLLNFIMGSRLLYGMSRLGLLPKWLGAVHPKTQTPHWGIVTVFVIALALGLSVSKVTLAGTTSALLLAVFATINLALVVIKLRDPAPSGVFCIPIFAPVVGTVVCLALVGFVPRYSLLALPVFMAAGGVIVAARWRQLQESAVAVAELDV
jgi:amino acid transporter